MPQSGSKALRSILPRCPQKWAPGSRSNRAENSQVHERPKCDTHGHFCLSFGNISISVTNSSTLISKIIVAKLNSCVKVVLYGI